MIFIYSLTFLFLFLLGYQIYSSYLVEGFDQSDLDKINSQLTILITKVNELSGTTDENNNTTQLIGDVEVLKSKMLLIEPAVNDFKTMKPTINGMIDVANKFIPCPSK
jgi:hypothetical protein